MVGRNDFRVRRATLDDSPGIATVHHASAVAAYVDIFPPEASKPTPGSLLPAWRDLLENRLTVGFVASRADAIVGCIVMHPDPAAPSGHVLSRLYVRPDLWGRGAGSVLHDRVVAFARSVGHRQLNLWVLEDNDRARGMYERRGWRYIEGPTIDNGNSVFDVLYEIDLEGSESSHPVAVSD